MQRPGFRPMRALPVLEARRDSLEKCVFCPKLCRTACPVSNAEPRETITPWGKMSVAWMAAHGDVPVDPSHASPAWACTGCYGCRELCDHRNPVADVLLDARAAVVARGVAPEGARRVLAQFAAHDAETRARVRQLAAEAPRGPAAVVGTAGRTATTALLVGCGYVRGAPAEARHAVASAAALAGTPVALVEGCCGLPLRLAGDLDAFRAHARALARTLESAGATRLLVVDAGCALALLRRYPDAGVDLPRRTKIELLVEVAAQSIASSRVSRSDVLASDGGPEPGRLDAPVLWHDPCQLGRGLGIYEAPRAVLTHVLGAPPGEFRSSREQAGCSGAGGLLPSTMPDVARTIAQARLQEARRPVPAARVVTGCASSLIAFRKAAAGAVPVVAVEDVVSFVARMTGSL